jgi:hypothetical protein
MYGVGGAITAIGFVVISIGVLNSSIQSPAKRFV